MPNIGIIVGSTRPGRVGPQVAEWALNIATTRGTAHYEIVDVQDFRLPLYAEPIPAAFAGGNYVTPEAHAWSDKIRSLDGFVFVTPEYNRSVPAALKNAIDYLGPEFVNKAAGIISYGSSGGVMAAAQLRIALSTLQVATVESAPALSLFTDFTEMTQFTPAAAHEAAVQRQLGQLESWAGAFTSLRTTPAAA